MKIFGLRIIAALALTFGLGSILPAQAQEKDPPQFRVAIQKGSVGLILAKNHHLLENRFPHTKITWVEFPAGPQILEALNVGSIDFGGTGDLPPLFAQAAGADLLYVGYQPPQPKAEVILVPENSPIKTVADLKGHTVAFQKGSSSNNFVLRALQQANLKFTDIKPINLAPSDALAAFQQHDVDAWAIWDPYYSAAFNQGGVRVLIDGTTLNQTGSFYLAPKKFTETNPQFISDVLKVLTQANALVKTEPQQSIQLLAKSTGLPEKVIATYFSHLPDEPITPVNAYTEKLQQATADLFYQNHLLPKPVVIKDRIWHAPALAQ
ncbi:aliphatic sulfonate ABC transporter substrate-binding protein [Rouxiella silvae]|uniref:Aliphatic sulfonate ABC transporter substrate-binding protein n=1 Tax=Rouxiella silvae TaxID=1646373 RepID=A0ABX3U6W5_9GAMM|nr:aliphatic sulfonate ABC transporter substrate-binding protein [Rouxiella silvae]ORJ23186.1 aliphatic sulfonate ABC transporter substrate-binding protein [Rouxiella silvae]